MSADPHVTLRRARPAEAAALAEISTRAFHSDRLHGGPSAGGPPGYDSPAWQQAAMGWGRYYAIVLEGQLAGGAIVEAKGAGHYELSRLFLSPEWHGQGVGRRVMALLWDRYPTATRWTLDTPAWNQRTRGFYESLGFIAIGRRPTSAGFELVLYERRSVSEETGHREG